MKKYIFLIIFLLAPYFLSAQEQQLLPTENKDLSPLEEQVLREKCEEAKKNSPFLTPDECLELKSARVRALDFRYAIQTELRNRNLANGFNYAALDASTPEPPSTLEIIITFLLWLGGILAFVCICVFVVKSVKNKISLRIKQHTGKHTLDDVFAAEKRK